MQSAMKTPTPSENERSYSMETIYKPSQGLRSSEIFDTTYNIGIRQGPSIFKPVHWENRKNLITTGLCTSIGVACLWRFPTYCYRFGGASFLYVYIVLLFLIGHPLFYFEILMGQLNPSKPSTRFNMCPILEGLSWAMGLVSTFMLLYFGLLCAYMCIYMTKSFNKNLPWMECEKNESCSNITKECSVLLPPEKFFFNTVMGVPSEIETQYWETHAIHWPVVMFLSVIWICVYLCIIIDFRTSRLFPIFLIIFIFLLIIPMIVGAQLTEGASKGLEELFVPIPINLVDFDLWWQALGQVLFSLGLSSGQALMHGAYSQLINPVYKDFIFLCCLVLLASLISSTITFSGVGILGSKIINKKCILGNIKKGPGSVFVFYSVAFSKLPFKHGWAFFLYFTAAIQIMFTMVEVIETILGMLTEYKEYFKKSRKTSGAIISIVLFLSSIPGSTQIGKDMIMVLDIYPIGMGLGTIAIFETFIIYLYHPKRLSNRKLYVFGKHIDKYYIYSWYYIPFVILILFTASIITNALMIPKILQFTTDFHVEVKAKIVGWFLYSLVMLAFLVKSVYNFFLYYKKKQLKEFLVVKESNTLVEFANANNNLVQLVPTPVLSSEANMDDHAGPSGVRPIWKLYYELPKTYFDIHPNSQLP